MNPLNQVNIQEQSTTYDIDMSYHSDCRGDDDIAEVRGIEHVNGTVSLYPWVNGVDWTKQSFTFIHSDPDRVIAVAQMMMAFAKMVKDHNAQNAQELQPQTAQNIDTNINV